MYALRQKGTLHTYFKSMYARQTEYRTTEFLSRAAIFVVLDSARQLAAKFDDLEIYDVNKECVVT